MKRIHVFFIILTLFSSGEKVNGADFPRHVDPASVIMDNPTPALLFEQYSQIYDLIISGEYDVAADSIISFDNITATPEVKESITRFNILLLEIIGELNQTDRRIDSGNNYLRYLLDLESEFQFSKALQNILAANYSSLELGIESMTLASLLQGDIQVVMREKKQLDDYIDYFYTLVDEGFEEITDIRKRKIEGLEESFIDLEVDNENPILGDTIILEGVLRNNESQGLAWKNLEIFISNDYLGSVNTSDYGEFSFRLQIPFIYSKDMVVRVEYYPIKQDVANYTPTFNQIILNPIFYTPRITLEVPQTLFPGVTYSIMGKIEYIGLSRTIVELDLLGKTSSTISDTDGNFLYNFIIPKDQPEGMYSLRVSTDPQGIIGPGLLEINFNVEYVSSRIVVDQLMRERAVFPIVSGPLVISGKVITGNYLIQNCLVECKLGSDIIQTYTDDYGVFIVSFDYSPFLLSARKSFTVFANPVEPWIEETQLVDYITVINLLTIVSLGVVVIGFFYSQRPRARALAPKIDAAEQEITFPRLRRLPGIYVRALEFISKKTGIYQAPSNTLREYLEIIKPRLGKAVFSLFRKLTQMYELWLYGLTKRRAPINTSRIIVDRMEELDE
jgi:hypothetical protein